MKEIEKLKGIIVPIVSPCDSAEKLDLLKLHENFERLIKTDISGLYICGGTGDGEKLSIEERKEIAAYMVPRLKKIGKSAIVHVGQTFQRAAIELAQHAAELGAEAIASIPPRASWDLIIEYYQAIASVGLPVIVYYIPQVTGITADFDKLKLLLEIDGVVGIKMTDWNLFLLHQLKLKFPDKIFYSGYDELLLAGLLYGADGCIGTWMNLLPEFYTKMYSLVNAGAYEKAIPLQNKFLEFLSIGWENGIINTFESLMAAKGYAQFCFRKPFARAAVNPSVISDMIERMDDIIACANAL